MALDYKPISQIATSQSLNCPERGRDPDRPVTGVYTLCNPALWQTPPAPQSGVAFLRSTESVWCRQERGLGLIALRLFFLSFLLDRVPSRLWALRESPTSANPDASQVVILFRTSVFTTRHEDRQKKAAGKQKKKKKKTKYPSGGGSHARQCQGFHFPTSHFGGI